MKVFHPESRTFPQIHGCSVQSRHLRSLNLTRWSFNVRGGKKTSYITGNRAVFNNKLPSMCLHCIQKRSPISEIHQAWSHRSLMLPNQEKRTPVTFFGLLNSRQLTHSPASVSVSVCAWQVELSTVSLNRIVTFWSCLTHRAVAMETYVITFTSVDERTVGSPPQVLWLHSDSWWPAPKWTITPAISRWKPTTFSHHEC